MSSAQKQIGDYWRFEVPRKLTKVFVSEPVIEKQNFDASRMTRKELRTFGRKG
jgi:hypothetical protein